MVLLLKTGTVVEYRNKNVGIRNPVSLTLNKGIKGNINLKSMSLNVKNLIIVKPDHVKIVCRIRNKNILEYSGYPYRWIVTEIYRRKFIPEG